MKRPDELQIFDIQGFSLHDGPGCRTLVFFSGCPLRCFWCANPEGQQQRRRLLFRSGRCRSCFTCIQACPNGAVSRLDSSPYPHLDRSGCDRCGDFICAEACPGEALVVSGRRITIAQLMQILNRDRFYWGSRGGVTIGGGEPFQQPQPLLTLLTACREAYIHTAVETCGAAAADDFDAALPLLDWLILDLKHLDEEAHRRGTGASNRSILENLRRLCRSDWPGRLLIRLTLVPGFNDDVGHLERLARFLFDLGIAEIQILPLHHLGASKYDQLGLDDPATQVPVPDAGKMADSAAIFRSRGLVCHLGAEESIPE